MRIRVIAIGAVVAAASALVLAGLAAGNSSKRHASLRLVKPAPLELAGLGFHARERVRIVATADGSSATKHVRASHQGSFAVGFQLRAGHCTGFQAVAVGSAGSRAVLERPPLPACLPQ